MKQRFALALWLPILAAACIHDWEGLEPRPDGSGGSGTGTTTGGAGGAAGVSCVDFCAIVGCFADEQVCLDECPTLLAGCNEAELVAIAECVVDFSGPSLCAMPSTLRTSFLDSHIKLQTECLDGYDP